MATKIVRLGTTNIYDKYADVFAKIKYENGNLSISGVEGPKQNGDALGSCGQIVMSRPKIHALATGWTSESVARFWDTWDRWHLNDMRAGCEHQTGPEWEPRDVSIYHFRLTSDALNAQKATEKAAPGALKAGETFTPTPGQTQMANLSFGLTSHVPDSPPFYEPAKATDYSRPIETKSTGWLRPDEHPNGFLMKPCPTCGYKYGSQWRRVDVPADVIEFLASLPDSDKVPAWV